MNVNDFPPDDVPDISIRMHYDINGSWLEVPLAMIYIMSMSAKNFSKYSYIDEKAIYLEEDVDAGKFLMRFEYLYGKPPLIEMLDHGEEALMIRDMDANIEGIDIILH